MNWTATRPPAWGTNCESAAARLRQKGHMKSENSTTLTGAVAGPLSGAVETSIFTAAEPSNSRWAFSAK